MLQEQIKQALQEARKSKSPELQDYQVIVGEFERQLTKELQDSNVISILKKLEANEVEKLEKTRSEPTRYLEVIRRYIPKQMGENEIIEYINKNVVFGALKNKMQAVGIVTGANQGKVDGKLVKEVLERYF